MTKRTINIKEVKGLKGYDLMSVLHGLVPQCTPEIFIAQGGYGRVYAGLYSKQAVLKAWNIQKYNTQNDLIVSNILILNPSPHIINIYQIKQKSNRLWIVMQKCNYNLQQYISKNLVQDFSQILKIIDQILRGVIHLHTLGIRIGKIDLQSIYVLEDNKFKTIKISLPSQASFFQGCGSSETSDQYKSQAYSHDLKLVVRVIVKLLWKENLDITKTKFKPTSSILMYENDQITLINLIQSALEKKISTAKFHKQFNKSIYKAKNSDLIQLSSESLLNSKVSLSSQTIDQKIVRVSQEYIKLEKESNLEAKKIEYSKNFKNKDRAMEFFEAIEDLLEEEKQRK